MIIFLFHMHYCRSSARPLYYAHPFLPVLNFSGVFVPAKRPPLLVDKHQREIHYLRLSITDRCNLRCRYCSVDDTFISHERVLRYEELERFIRVAISMGVHKVRLTGGEPFVRKGFPEFLTRLRSRHPDVDFRVTSNGVMLAPHAPLLRTLRVHVNLSLDTFQADKFAYITGRDLLPKVQESLAAMLAAGVSFKVNAVAMRGFNDDELPDFLNFATLHGVDIRFIEFMPIGGSTIWSPDRYWPATEILASAENLAVLTQVPPNADTDGPARMFRIGDSKGRFGLITPISNHFCATCNRLRLTSDGKLRTCLFDDKEYRLAPLLRHSKLGDQALMEVLRRATWRKPLGTRLLEGKQDNAVAQRAMTSIGG
jgi:cyclic pyranopterin phosphate synthase